DASRASRTVVGAADSRDHCSLAQAGAPVQATAERHGDGAPPRQSSPGEPRVTRRLAVWARATAHSGLAEALGRRGPRLVLLGFQEAAQGMADDLIAAGFEADTRLEGIEIAVELLAQGNGHADGQHTGGLVSFRTSSDHSRLHACEVGSSTRLEMGSLSSLFYTKDIFCKHKIERDDLLP